MSLASRDAGGITHDNYILRAYMAAELLARHDFGIVRRNRIFPLIAPKSAAYILTEKRPDVVLG